MARGRKTGGRLKGSKNKRTLERERATQQAIEQISAAVPGAFEGDAHALLMAVYKDPRQPLQVRLEAAKAALPYEKPRPLLPKVEQEALIEFIFELDSSNPPLAAVQHNVRIAEGNRMLADDSGD